ncbi:MAG: linear amide C-N hydrolase [Candidatus Marinimicrobia bacterium]|nr:linear amide C-N hydrolase [Candidatus Neomarinimicrobiota bacterium]
MNEAGLVIEELSLFGQPYTCDESKQLLNEFQWVQYQLDNSANIPDVIQSLEKITIRHAIMNLHYLLTDRGGNTAVIECLETGVVVYSGEDLPFKALSNNNYKEGIHYLGFFEGYGGEMKVQHRRGSQERFVSAVSMLDHFTPEVDRISYSFHILNTVKQEDTRWQFVYDIKDLSITYKTHGIPGEFSMGFEDLKKIRHNKFAIRLFGDKHKQVKMTAGKNKEHLKYIKGELDEYFPGNETIYDLMVIEGNKSLRTRLKK